MRLDGFVSLLTLLAVMVAGVATAEEAARVEMRAVRAEEPMKIDGRLDEAVWQQARAYALHLAGDADPEGKDAVDEGGEARLAWDGDNLYVAIRYEDSDVVAEGTERNGLHFEQGDVAEVFVKPLSNTVYWELYVTPHAMTSTFFFPSWSRNLPGSFTYEMDITVGAEVDGTLNDWQDRDRGWTGEMAIPIRELEKYGDDFPGKGWTILVARYNYGRYLEKKGPELTMTPRQPMTSYHNLPGYALLKLEK